MTLKKTRKLIEKSKLIKRKSMKQNYLKNKMTKKNFKFHCQSLKKITIIQLIIMQLLKVP